jgi:hypothetical protein
MDPRIIARSTRVEDDNATLSHLTRVLRLIWQIVNNADWRMDSTSSPQVQSAELWNI